MAAVPTMLPTVAFADSEEGTHLCAWEGERSPTTGLLRRCRLESSEDGVVACSVSYSNEGSRPFRLPAQESLRLDLRRGEAEPEHWWVEKGAGWSGEIGTHREPVPDGYRFLGRFSGYAPDVGEEMIPWSAIVDPKTGDGWIVALAFSGNGRLDVRREGDTIRLALGIDGDAGYRTIIEPGGRFAAPTAYLLPFRGGLDEGTHRWRRFVQTRLRPPSPDPRYPLLVNNSWGSGLEIDEPLAKKMIDDAADLGFEMFGIDAGWFRALGDWRENRDKFPNGIAAVSDYAHAKGLLCGLWVAWTQGDRRREGGAGVSFENPGQRTWFGQDYGPEWEKVLPYIGADLCLASAEAREWCLSELTRIVRETKIDMLEHDQRMVIERCVREDHGHTSHPADVSYRAAEGYQWVYDRLRREFPHLGFENCVNGGRMIDFAALRCCHYVCVSDSYNRLNVRRAFYDSSRALPPMMCETYLNQDPGPTLGTFKAMLRSGLMGFCTLMIDTGAWPLSWRDAARRQFGLYKLWIRPLIVDGRLYHVSERPDGKRWDGMQYHDPRNGKGVLFAFRGSEGDAEHRFLLRGLDPDAPYRLTFEDGSQPSRRESGKALMEEGLAVRLEEPGTSELVLIRT